MRKKIKRGAKKIQNIDASCRESQMREASCTSARLKKNIKQNDKTVKKIKKKKTHSCFMGAGGWSDPRQLDLAVKALQ